eukprot:3049915-Pleurochrysis_carterae.AAC.1
MTQELSEITITVTLPANSAPVGGYQLRQTHACRAAPFVLLRHARACIPGESQRRPYDFVLAFVAANIESGGAQIECAVHVGLQVEAADEKARATAATRPTHSVKLQLHALHAGVEEVVQLKELQAITGARRMDDKYRHIPYIPHDAHMVPTADS